MVTAAHTTRLLLCLLVCSIPAFGIGQTRFVEFSPTPEALALVDHRIAAPILVDSQDYEGVLRAARDLQADIRRVTLLRPALVQDAGLDAPDIVVVGVLGKNRRIAELVRAGKLDAEAIRGRWESFLIQVVANPWPGVKRALIIAGSDKRGAIYGIYD